MLHVAVVIGTRPEAIKLAPVILEMKSRPNFRVTLVNSGQHREILDEALSVFGLDSDVHLGLLVPGQSLASLTSKAIAELHHAFHDLNPDVVMVHGDTTTALSAAIASFYLKIPVAHVEAGLRTNNIYSPFPEEFNRQTVGRISAFNFAPTLASRKNLLNEGVPADRIFVTGNTVVDAAAWVAQNYLSDSDWVNNHSLATQDLGLLETLSKPFGLITLHRRENHGAAFEEILSVVRRKAIDNRDFDFVFPVHPSPAIAEPARRILGGLENVHLIPPVDYLTFLLLLANSKLILSDSGGVQEEAVTFGKLVLIARDSTERPEGLMTGFMELVGSDAGLIGKRIQDMVDEAGASPSWSLNLSNNPFGKGKAAIQICDQLSLLL